MQSWQRTCNNYTVVSSTSLVWFKRIAEPLFDSAKSATSVHVIDPYGSEGEDISDSTESFELDARLLIDSSDELCFTLSNLSRSSSLENAKMITKVWH